MNDPDVWLTINGQDYGGWKRVRIERSLTQCTIKWGVIATRNWPGMAQQWDIALGDAVTVMMGDTQIVSGWIDQMSPSYSGESHEIEIAGRGKLADVIDCTPVDAPPQWKQVAPGQIIRDICDVFGVRVVIDAPLDEPMDFKLQQGETGWAAIERLCRLRAILAYEQTDGALLITRVSEEYCDTALVQGSGERTILEGSAKLADNEQFSVVIVKGQQPGADNVTPKQAAESLAQAQDPSIRRYRPLVIYQAAKTSVADAQERANWEVQRRWGASRSVDITVTGWLTDGDEPWPLNRLCRIEDAWLGIDREMTITGTIFELGANGRTTVLTLEPPEALTPNPDDLKPEVTDKAGASGGTDYWRQVGMDRERGERRRLESKQ